MTLYLVAAIVITVGLIGLWRTLTDDTADRIHSLPDPSYEREIVTGRAR